MNYDTILSKDRKHRYTLFRDVLKAPGACSFPTNDYLMFVGLNPSIADETKDDATIRVCRNYAQAWGFRRLCMTNLFAYRETNPKEMFMSGQPVGPSNDFHLLDMARGAGAIIACWGHWGSCYNRDLEVINLLSDFPIHVLSFTQNWAPHHPLRMTKVKMPIRWLNPDREIYDRDILEEASRMAPVP